MRSTNKAPSEQTPTNTSKENTDAPSGVETGKILTGADCPICRGVKFTHPLLTSGEPDISEVVPCFCTEQENET